MDMAQLACFLTVAQTLNFSEAARRQQISQPTASRYIGDLEREFGVRLFTRSKRDVVLTEEGRALLPYAQEALEALNRAQTVLSQMRAGGAGRISVGCDATSGAFPVACLRAFSEQYPEIAVELAAVPGSKLALALRDGEYDFLFLPRDMVPEGGGLDTRITHYETLSLVVPKGSPLAKGPVDLQALQQQRFVALSERESPILYMEILELFSAFHFTPNIVSSHDSVKSLVLAVAAGLGLAVLPTDTARGCAALVDAVEIDTLDTEIPYAVAWNHTMANPAAQLFLQTVERLAAKTPPAML